LDSWLQKENQYGPILDTVHISFPYSKHNNTAIMLKQAKMSKGVDHYNMEVERSGLPRMLQ